MSVSRSAKMVPAEWWLMGPMWACTWCQVGSLKCHRINGPGPRWFLADMGKWVHMVPMHGSKMGPWPEVISIFYFGKHDSANVIPHKLKKHSIQNTMWAHHASWHTNYIYIYLYPRIQRRQMTHQKLRRYGTLKTEGTYDLCVICFRKSKVRWLPDTPCTSNLAHPTRNCLSYPFLQ